MATEPKSTIDAFAQEGLGSKTDNWLAAILGYLNCLWYQQISVIDAPIGLTPPEGAVFALIVVEGNVANTDAQNLKCIRFREDGTNPTTAVGMPLGDLSAYDCKGVSAMESFKAISTVVGVAQKMNVQYYG